MRDAFILIIIFTMMTSLQAKEKTYISVDYMNGHHAIHYLNGEKYINKSVDTDKDKTDMIKNRKYIGSIKNKEKQGIETIYPNLGSNHETGGEGWLVESNKNIEIGCRTGDCINGRGTFVYSDSSIYEGDFLNGQPNGYGICYFADGDIYVGFWKNSFFEGKGTFYYKDGGIIKGNWKESYLLKEESSLANSTIVNKEEEGKVWAVIVGVAKYTAMKALNYTDDDAYRLYSFFKSVEGGAVPDNQIKLFIDEGAEKKQILKALEEIAGKAKKSDSFIFYFSGHGLPGSFLPFDYDGYENELKYDEIMEIFKSSVAKSKIIIADACHSGGLIAHRGESYELTVQTYYEAINQSEGGLVLMTSSKAEETSIENNGLRQGIFSHFLIRGLKGAGDENNDDVIRMDELFKYIEMNVRFYTSNYQTPLIFGDNGIDLPIAVVRK